LSHFERQDIADSLQKVVTGSVSRQHQTETGPQLCMVQSCAAGSTSEILVYGKIETTMERTLCILWQVFHHLPRLIGTKPFEAWHGG